MCWVTVTKSNATHSLSCIPGENKTLPVRLATAHKRHSTHNYFKKVTTIKEKEARGHEFERKHAGAGECPKGLEGEKGKGEMIGLYLIKKIKTLYKITFKL